MRVLTAAVVWPLALLAAPPKLHAGDLPPVWKDGWTINAPGQSYWIAGGPPGSAYFPRATATPFSGAEKDPHGFADFSIGHTLGFGRERGLGNMQATLGVRMAEPLAGNWFTPAFDPRRYLGVGPRIGFEGNRPLQSSWVVEWKVGAALLSGDRTFDAGGVVVNSALPNFANSGSLVNVDGLLGLSYWFDSASKLTLGYRADYFKGSATVNLSGTAAESTGGLNHGPMVRFTIQK